MAIYSDRIEIENYWIKPNNFVLGRTIFRRNPIITDLFLRIKFGERMGSGIERMRRICREWNAPSPEIEAHEDYFYITFRPSLEYLKLATPQKTPQKILTLLERNIVGEISKNPSISRREISNILKISPDTVKEYLKKLKKKRAIKRVGPDRGGYWVVIS